MLYRIVRRFFQFSVLDSFSERVRFSFTRCITRTKLSRRNMFLRRNFPFPWKILVHRCVIIVRGTIPIFFRSTFFRSLRDSRERDNFSRSRWPRGRRGSASSEVLRFKHLSTRVMEGRGDQVGSSTRVLTLFRSSRNYIHFPTLPGCILLSSFREYFSLRVAPVLVV